MQDLPITRQSLIVRLKSSSDDAWAEVLTVYEDAIVRFCRARGLQDADARDVTQEVFSALHDRIDQWDPDSSRGSFRGWLFRVARNIAVDRIRERTKGPIAAGENVLAGVADTNEQETSAFLFEYRRSLFQWAADQVRDEVQDTTWQCFLQTAIDDRKPVDVARELNISVGTVYTAKCRVVARIREKATRLSGAFDQASLADAALLGGLVHQQPEHKIEPPSNEGP